MLETRLLYVRRSLLQNFKMRELLVDDGEPAQPIAFVRTRPERSVPLPKARYFIVFFSSPRCMRRSHLQAGRVTCRSGGLGSRGDTCSLAHRTQQGLESVRKEFDAVNHQLVRYFFHGNPGFR